MSSDAPMWGARELTIRFGDTFALSGVTLALAPGEITAVVGGDGAGKTTLLRALAGRVVPQAGSISAPPGAEIGFQPATSGVWRQLSVDENVAFVGRAYGMEPTRLAARKRELLGRAGLDAAGARLGGELSGGMRQKLGFCLAMLHEPRLLLLDEPSTGVDPVSRVELWRLVAEAAAVGTAVLLATTYLDEAERAQRVLVLEAGRALAFGEPDAIVRERPGTIAETPHRPAVAAQGRAWRRGTAFHAWYPPGEAPIGHLATADLEDTVIALALARTAPPPPPTSLPSAPSTKRGDADA